MIVFRKENRYNRKKDKELGVFLPNRKRVGGLLSSLTQCPPGVLEAFSLG